MSKQIEKTTIVDELREKTMAQTDTAKKIRYLTSQGKKINEIYKLLKEYGVKTKDGNEIRYQHVRNTVMQKLSTNN